MQVLNMKDHDFCKTNLVTQAKGDHYRCSVCGAQGWRQGFSGTILVNDAEFRISKKCTFKQNEVATEISTANDVEFTKEVYEVVNTPWTRDLPNSTLIEKVIRKNEEWYIRLDRKQFGDTDKYDGCFKLYAHECRKIKNFTYEEALAFVKMQEL